MPLTQRQLVALLDEVIEERAPAVSLTSEEMEDRVAALHARFARVREATEERRRLMEVLTAQLPPERVAGWAKSGALAALRVVLSTARRSSRIMTEAARDLLPLDPAAWRFVGAEAAVARGASADPGRADAAGAQGEPSAMVIVDDTGDERRILFTAPPVLAGRPAPVMLLVGAVPDPSGGRVVREVDPEEQPETKTATPRPLRYEAVLPPGDYYLFVGNPRPVSGPRRDA